MNSTIHNNTGLTIEATVKAAEQLYSHLNGLPFYKHKLRPYICPFHSLIELVPQGASVLDIGCGSGLFASLLAYFGHAKIIHGFDASQSAIETAKTMLSKNTLLTKKLMFEYRDARKELPEGIFDVVSMIDVLHHVPPDAQAAVIKAASARVAPGGILLYKDMVKKPRWRALANRLHDLVLAREWINYASLNEVKEWAISSGLKETDAGACNMLWYGHEWIVMQRPIN